MYLDGRFPCPKCGWATYGHECTICNGEREKELAAKLEAATEEKELDTGEILQILFDAVIEIEKYGREHPGFGYSCSKIALEALRKCKATANGKPM